MYMFKNLFRRIKRKRILRIIKKAKNIYLTGEYDFMCICFVSAMPARSYSDIVKIIPEFQPSTFGLDCSPHSIWWASNDRESRIKAFDKLIEIYSK